MKVSDLLSCGQANSIPLRQLMIMTGVDGRTIREKIAAERMSGIPILSDNKTGYFLPANEKEKERFVQNMKHRAKEIERAAKAVEKSTYEKGI